MQLLLFFSQQGIEVYKGRFILYGCGDFLNDYQVYEQVLSMQGVR